MGISCWQVNIHAKEEKEGIWVCLLSGVDCPYTSSCPYVEDMLRVRIDWGEVELIIQRKEVDMMYDIKSIQCLVCMSIL